METGVLQEAGTCAWSWVGLCKRHQKALNDLFPSYSHDASLPAYNLTPGVGVVQQELEEEEDTSVQQGGKVV
jgi:hypothetical protein